MANTLEIVASEVRGDDRTAVALSAGVFGAENRRPAFQSCPFSFCASKPVHTKKGIVESVPQNVFIGSYEADGVGNWPATSPSLRNGHLKCFSHGSARAGLWQCQSWELWWGAWVVRLLHHVRGWR